jgi:methionyl-tRNA synthetase
MVGNEVLMVSGSDVHGTPITVRADAEGVTAQDIVDRYHGEFVRQWDEIGLQWDLYTTTGTDHHARVTQEMFLKQLEQGFIDKRTSSSSLIPRPIAFFPTATSRAPVRTVATAKPAAISATTAAAPSTPPI